ncbi:MAG: TIGR02996 domain-containing protein [Gemmataceae bacterium]|nr:TIGR02996 domain-containing protein [Gemmataceae bacterium]
MLESDPGATRRRHAAHGLADWLDEQDHARAQFTRTQCELSRQPDFMSRPPLRTQYSARLSVAYIS